MKNEGLEKTLPQLKIRIRFAIDCKSNPFFVCMTIAFHDGNVQENQPFDK